MKVRKVIGSGLAFEAEGETQVALFEALAEIDKSREVFGETECGVCHSKNISFKVRDQEYQDRDEKTGELLFVESGKLKGQAKMTSSRFYEMVCNIKGCWAKKQYGQRKEKEFLGDMFPKNKNKDKEWLPNSGWVKFEKSASAAKPEVENAPPAKPTTTNTKKADEETPF